MKYRVITADGTHRIDADGQTINEGGDLVLYQRLDGAIINDTSIPPILTTVALFAQGYWKISEVLE
jgi:hypothetical protein